MHIAATHNVFSVSFMVTRLNNMVILKNIFAKELFSPKYKPKTIKPKKGKGSFKRRKN